MQSVAAVLARDGTNVIGTAFLVDASGLVVTCAHVLEQAGIRPGGSVQLRMQGQRVRAQVLDGMYWSSTADIAFAALGAIPAGARPAVLGRSRGSRHHRFRTHGFPLGERGVWGYGAIGDRRAPDVEQIQLYASHEITSGFSGAPLFDEQTRRVVGMVVSITEVDPQGRLAATSFVIPSESICAIATELVPSEDCPYRDLMYFTEDDVRFWHGRGGLIAAARDLLGRRPPCMAVFGPSGSGKSSFLRAGLVPLFRELAQQRGESCSIVVQRPVDNPFASAAVTAALAADQTLVVIIDQLEDVFVSFTPERRRAFLDEMLVHAGRPSTWLVVGMRDDYYSQLAREAPLVFEHCLAALLQVPMYLTRDELCAIIRKPAEAVGLALDPPDLDAVIADAVVRGRPGPTPGTAAVAVLPLLEVYLMQMWNERDDGALRAPGFTVDALAEALSARAHDAYHGLTATRKEIADLVLIELIDPTRSSALDKGARVPLARLRAGSAPPDDLSAVLERFINDRIVVALRDPDSGLEIIELIHDALLTHWSHYIKLRRDGKFAEFIGLKRDLGWAVARHREARTRAERRRLLLSSDDLGKLARWRARGAAFDADIDALVQASGRWSRIRRFTAIGAAVAVATVAVVFAFVARDATEQRGRAEAAAIESRAEALAAQGRDLLAGRPTLGFRLIADGAQLAPDSSLVFGAGLHGLLEWRSLHEVRDVPREITSLAISPDNQWLIRGDSAGNVAIVERSTGRVASPEALASVARSDYRVISVSFAPDGRRAVATDDDDKLVSFEQGPQGAWSAVTYRISGLHGARFAPAGALYARVDDSLVRIDLDAHAATVPVWQAQRTDKAVEWHSSLQASARGTMAMVVPGCRLMVWHPPDKLAVVDLGEQRPDKPSFDMCSRGQAGPLVSVAIDDRTDTIAVGFDRGIVLINGEALAAGKQVAIDVETFDDSRDRTGQLRWVSAAAFIGPELVTAHFTDLSGSVLTRWRTDCPGSGPPFQDPGEPVLAQSMCPYATLGTVPGRASVIAAVDGRIVVASGPFFYEKNAARLWTFSPTVERPVFAEQGEAVGDANAADVPSVSSGVARCGSAGQRMADHPDVKMVHWAGTRSCLAFATSGGVMLTSPGTDSEMGVEWLSADVAFRQVAVGARAVAAFAESTLYVWVLDSGRSLVTIPVQPRSTEEIEHMEVSDSAVVWDDKEKIHVVRIGSRHESQPLDCRSRAGYLVHQLSPDGRWLAALCAVDDTRSHVSRLRVWALAGGSEPRDLGIDTELMNVDGVQFSDDSTHLQISGKPPLRIDLRAAVWRDHICGHVDAASLTDALGYVGTPAFDACLSPPLARTSGATHGP